MSPHDAAPPDHPLLDATLRGLRATPRTLPCELLYDDLGSALFEAITHLPEYELTRADLRLIEAHANDVFDALPGVLDVVELGPGGGRKALQFLTPLCARQATVSFAGVDVSTAALNGCRRVLEALPGVAFHGVAATYLDGLRSVSRSRGARRLVLFLGSNLSNFARHEAVDFLRALRATMERDDALLLATDIGDKPERLLPAYDDALGVTAAFNRNVLLRINRSWGATFDLTAFTHTARWNAPERRVEMHLVATRATEATLRGERFSFAAGDTLWTESSHRFDPRELRAWATEAGFTCAAQWIDRAWPFAHSLFVA